MTSTATADRPVTTRTKGAGGSDPSGNLVGVQTAVREIGGALQGVGRSVPGVARASRSAVDDLFHAIEAGSDERVSAGVTLSLGLAIGMLIGGAPRLLIMAALAPVAVMGLVLADRRAKGSRTAG
jgi:hypothetical protein